MRDNSDPFQVPDEIFLKYYRFTKESTHDIIEMMRPHLLAAQRQTSVPIELKVNLFK